MRIVEICERVDAIRKAAHDPESAHGLEDSLLADFVRYVAGGGADELQEKARLVMSTALIDFPRWCA